MSRRFVGPLVSGCFVFAVLFVAGRSGFAGLINRYVFLTFLKAAIDESFIWLVVAAF